MTPARPILEIDDLEVVYSTEAGTAAALRGVGFSLGRGEALGLVGESGSGKTTIGLAIMRHLSDNGRIVGGSIRFDGIDLVPLGPRALRRARGQRMAMVYQDPANALNPSLKVGPQIAEAYRIGRNAGRCRTRDSTVALLERVHLPDAAYAYDRYPHEFSGGQQQRIVIAMALAMNPDLLVLDEPTTGLDATVEAEILDLFAELRRSVHAGIVFISHNIAVIARMCERVGVLYAGQVVEIGPTDEILRQPSHPYTRALLSARIPFGATKKELALSTSDEGAAGEAIRGFAACSFEPRCAFAEPRCRAEPPPLLRSAADRWSRCFFHHRVQASPLRPRRRPAADTAPGSGSILEMQDVEKRFGSAGRSFRAVAGAKLGLATSSVLGIVGESGSGKTTTVRMAAGLLVPDSGKVLLDGKDVTRPVERRDTAARRALQMVFQNPDSTLNPKHRIGGILRRTLRKLTGIRGEECESLVRRAMQAVHLDAGYLEAFPDELSGGQRQRVAIARAFIANPQIVLCDEPTSALDVSIQAAILDLLVDLQAKEGVSYVFISHDLGVIRYMADQVAVMYLGEVVEIGPAGEVFAAPNHPYTETLLSAVLSLDGGSPQRIALSGPAPSLLDRPKGCPFHPRCPRKVGPICESAPPWQEPAPGHRYRCVIGSDELRGLQQNRKDGADDGTHEH
jgi:peptide/nickel transport system ATP-binding protein